MLQGGLIVIITTNPNYSSLVTLFMLQVLVFKAKATYLHISRWKKIPQKWCYEEVILQFFTRVSEQQLTKPGPGRPPVVSLQKLQILPSIFV